MEAVASPNLPKLELSDRIRRQLQTGEIIYHSIAKEHVSNRFPQGKWVAEVRRVEKGRLKRYPRHAYGTPQEALQYIVTTRPGAKGTTPAVRMANEKTVGELYEEWRRHGWKNISTRTKDERERRWRLHIHPYWAGWTLSQVRRRAAQEWLTEAEESIEAGEAGTLGLAQLREVRLDLHAMFKFAVRNEFGDYDRANPFEDLEAKVQPPRALITIESQHFAPILHAADLLSRPGFVTDAGPVVPWVAQMFATSLLSGLRRGEAMAFMWDRIDWANGAIRVDRAMRRKAQDINERTGVPSGPVLRQAVNFPKGDRLREVPMSDQLIAILQPLYEQRKMNPTGRPFIWPGETDSLKEDTRVQLAFRNLCKWLDFLAKAVPLQATNTVEPALTRWSRVNEIARLMVKNPGLRIPDVFDRLDYRDTRNSFSSYLNELGLPQATHQQIMGHGPIGVTGTFYTRVTSKAFQDAREKISSGWSLGVD
jgi:integrase